MKTLYFLISSLLLMASVGADEENIRAAETEENAYQENEKQYHCYRRCYRRYSYHPIRTCGYYYYYDNRYIPTWPTRNNFYFFDILRR